MPPPPGLLQQQRSWASETARRAAGKKARTWQEVQDLADEAEMARDNQVPWKLRGPPPPVEGGPSEWRGQAYRPGSERWANRGGANKEWYSAVYFYKGRGCTYAEAEGLAKGNGKGWNKPGDGKGGGEGGGSKGGGQGGGGKDGGKGGSSRGGSSSSSWWPEGPGNDGGPGKDGWGGGPGKDGWGSDGGYDGATGV